VIAGNQKDSWVLIATPLECFREAFPEIGTGIRIVEDIANAEDSIYRISACDVEDPPNDIHAGA
jgi:hypothetical protein